MTAAPPKSRFDSPEQEAFLNLWRTYDRLRALEDDLFARYDLTPQQYNALRLLRAEHPGTLQTLALADRLVSRAPDITRLLDKLEIRGLVGRDRLADNRRVVRRPDHAGRHQVVEGDRGAAAGVPQAATGALAGGQSQKTDGAASRRAGRMKRTKVLGNSRLRLSNSQSLSRKRLSEITMNPQVVVIGGGPAGSTAATLLAQQGYRVQLFEREHFPRFHIGESLIPETYWVLKRLDMLDKMKDSPFVKKYSVQFVNQHGKLSRAVLLPRPQAARVLADLAGGPQRVRPR